MKMNRNQLKDLIKECLVEILSEGIGSGATQKLDEARTSTRPNLAHAALQQRRAAPPVRSPVRSPLVQAANILAAGNPQMARIFADTAQTTLPTMMSQPDPESSQRSLQQYMHESNGNPYDQQQFDDQPLPATEDYPNLASAAPEQVWGSIAFGPSKMPSPATVPSLPKDFLDSKVG